MSTDAVQVAGLRRPTTLDLQTIADWHPIPTEEVVGWWNTDDVEPWVMLDADDQLIGYGEIWTDDEEDEVELARLIVPAELRGRGLGKALVRLLLPKAAESGMATTFLRVDESNDVAIRTYLATGFYRLGPEESKVWNEGQRQEWVWMLLGPDPAVSS
jgi:ribosomal protein S18 acetylase RimI-like enzyme